MDESTRRILARALALLKEYRENRLRLGSLVSGLEGSLSALGQRMPEVFYTQWYMHWGGLEEVLAVGGENSRREDILGDVRALEELLSTYLQARQDQR